MLQLEFHKRSKPRHPLHDHYVASWISHEIKPPQPPLTTMLHLELHKRSKPGHPLWPLCCILNFTWDQNPANPSDHYVASWTSQEIKTPPPPLTTMLHLELHERSKPATPSDHYMLHLEFHKRSKTRHPLWPLCCILNFTSDQKPATPLTTVLHLELHKRSKARHPLWPLCCILNFTRDQNPAIPSDHCVASWISHEIKTRHPLWPLCCILNVTWDQNPPPPLTTMLHLEFHMRSKPRHPLWPLCCILNFTRGQNPATPSDHYVASWISQKIKNPPPPLTTMLHFELHKRSKPRHPLLPLCCILNFTSDQNPAAPSDHYVASWISQEIKPHHPLWPLCCILNFTIDQNPATQSDHYVASWTSQAIKTPPPPLTTMLHLEFHMRSKPATPSDHYVASWTSQAIKTPPPSLTTMLHLELHKRSKPRHPPLTTMLHLEFHKRSKSRHPLWPLCYILNFTWDQKPATPSDHCVASWMSHEIKTRHPLWPLCCILNFTRDQNPAIPSDHYVASWISHEIKSPPPPLTTMLHLEPHKRSEPRHPLWPLCCILNFTRDQNPATPSGHYVAYPCNGWPGACLEECGAVEAQRTRKTNLGRDLIWWRGRDIEQRRSSDRQWACLGFLFRLFWFPKNPWSPKNIFGFRFCLNQSVLVCSNIYFIVGCSGLFCSCLSFLFSVCLDSICCTSAAFLCILLDLFMCCIFLFGSCLRLMSSHSNLLHRKLFSQNLPNPIQIFSMPFCSSMFYPNTSYSIVTCFFGIYSVFLLYSNPFCLL